MALKPKCISILLKYSHRHNIFISSIFVLRFSKYSHSLNFPFSFTRRFYYFGLKISNGWTSAYITSKLTYLMVSQSIKFRLVLINIYLIYYNIKIRINNGRILCKSCLKCKVLRGNLVVKIGPPFLISYYGVFNLYRLCSNFYFPIFTFYIADRL